MSIRRCGARASSLPVRLAIFLCLVAPRLAQAQVSPDLSVRIYDAMRLAIDTVGAAQGVVEETFRDAGLALRWQACDGSAGRCEAPPAAGEMVVRLRTAPPAFREDPRRLPLGQSILAPPGEASMFATVYPDRIRHLSDRANVPLGMLLGYAIAHELTHLLLRSGAHTQDGLMREHWTADAVRDLRKQNWALRSRDRALVALAAKERAALRAARVLRDATRIPERVGRGER